MNNTKEKVKLDQVLKFLFTTSDKVLLHLLAIQNLIEYLSRNYLNDEELEEEVIKVTKTLYDPEVEKRGIEIGEVKTKAEDAKVLIRHGVSKDIIMALGLSEQRIAELIEEVAKETSVN